MGRLEDLLIGRRIDDRYAVEAILGRGGMGVVYRALDTRLDRAVALKVLSPPAALEGYGPALRARFRREARAAASIRHPNVVSVHDFGTDGELDLDYLVMELLEGEDLSRLVARVHPLQPEWILTVLRQTASGLAAGHRKGVVHRDVKPANIFLTRDDSGGVDVRLLDFGIAQPGGMEEGTITRLTQLGQAPMTPVYASPEQAAGRAELTPASDVYSLGMTALAMLSPEPPPEGAGRRRVPALEEVDAPPGLRRVLAGMLHPDPARRFADGDAVAHALARLASEAEPGSAVRTPPPVHTTGVETRTSAPLSPAARRPERPSRRKRPRARSRVPVGWITGLAACTVGAAAMILQGWGGFFDPSPGGPVPPPASVAVSGSAGGHAGSLPAPRRPWPSLTPEEEQRVSSARRGGMTEREALLRLLVAAGAGCDAGSEAACERSREIGAYVDRRALIQVPDAGEQEALAREGASLVRQIQESRVLMGLRHPRLHTEVEGTFRVFPARAFLYQGHVHKIVADVRPGLSRPGAERIVEESYYDWGGRLVYVRQRTWTGGSEPEHDRSFHFRGDVLVRARTAGGVAEVGAPALQLAALLAHRRGETIRRSVQDGVLEVPVSVGDLIPGSE